MRSTVARPRPDDMLGNRQSAIEPEIFAMTIYALKAGVRQPEVLSSLGNGEGQFEWSAPENKDLLPLRQRIEKRGWQPLADAEQDCYQSFLLDLKDGDHLIYVNEPKWGQCISVKAAGPCARLGAEGEFKHRFPVDSSSICVFDRTSGVVSPGLGAGLKQQGRCWRIYAVEDFFYLLKANQDGKSLLTGAPEH